MISVIKYKPVSDETPVGEVLLVYVEDDSSDHVWKYTTYAWRTKHGEWIQDNDYLMGNVLGWARFPDPKNMTVED
mgnify:CR=1 FL=1